MKLSTKYLMNIITSLLFFPIAFFLVNFIYFITLTYIIDDQSITHYEPEQLEKRWKSDVANLKGKTNEEILSSFSGMKRYKDSDIIWMNDEGKVLYSTSAGYPEGKTDLTVTDVFNMMRRDNKNYFLLQV
ncbi:hypothetical protein P4U97_10780 [Bacillus swezeyi]|nr:hypothetical protein [Bacillus swezeyi]